MTMYTIEITSEAGNPLPGTVRYLSSAGGVIGQQEINPQGGQLNPDLLSGAAVIEVSAEGYYSFSTPTDTLHDDNQFILVKKESPIKYIVMGAAALFILNQITKR